MRSHFLKPIYLLFLIVCFYACKNDKKTDVQTVNVRLEADPDRLNPMLSATGYAADVYKYIFYPLADLDPFTLKLSPVLIKALPVKSTLDTGIYKRLSVYSFEILDEAKWDNGTPVTGYDLAFTIKAAFNPLVNAERWRAPLGFVKDVVVNANNPKNFQVVLGEEYFLAGVFISSINVYPEYLFDPKSIMRKYSLTDLMDVSKSATLSEKDPLIKEFANEFNNAKYGRDPEFISGAGPYKLTEWTTGQKLVLKKKENWWGDKLAKSNPMLEAYPKELVFKIIADATATISMLKDGQIDAVGGFTSTQFKELLVVKSITENYNISTPTVLQYLYFAMNNQNPKLSDKRVRRAIAHLMDLDKALGIMDGLAERITGPIHPSKSYYNSKLKPIAFDVAEANRLLDEAGWKDTDGNGIRDKNINGKTIQLEIKISLGASSETGKKLSLMLQENGKKAGVGIVLDAREMSQIMADVKAGKYEMSPLKNRLDPVLDDPYNLWNSVNITAGGGNLCAYSNPEIDKITEGIRTAKDEESRNALYMKFQEILYNDQAALFVFAPKEPVLISKKYPNAKPTILKPGFVLNYFH